MFLRYPVFVGASVLLFAPFAALGNTGQICLPAEAFSSSSGDPVKCEVNIGGKVASAWSFSGDKTQAVSTTLKTPPKAGAGVKIEAVIVTVDPLENPSAEDVYRATLFQKKNDGAMTNVLKGVPVRTVASPSGGSRTIELESCYIPEAGLPITVQIERKGDDMSDSLAGSTALLAVKMTPVAELPAPLVVEDRKGYNSWPMIQAIGSRLVCVYSRGLAHTIRDGERDAYVRTSDDCGKTWSAEMTLTADADYGEVPIGKGLDENGDMLVWVRFDNGKDNERMHKLYRTKDGKDFALVATLQPDPMPMQITDVFSVPTVGLMALWFTGNYGEKALNAWGTLVSKDNGATWTQNVVESGLNHINWCTEPSAVYLGDGKILVVSRIEHNADSTQKAQFQMESTDYGCTWKRSRTNIGDVFISTPSLIYDEKTGLISNYYYQRGRGMLKRRVVEADKVFGNPLAWPDPEIVAFASAIGFDAGNVNATLIGNTHYLAYYSGDSENASVVISSIAAPGKAGNSLE